MTEYPMITELLGNFSRWPERRKYNKELETELRALLAERDALAAKAPMERKLREYKGVTYRGGSWHYRDMSAFMASALISGYCDTFTDADHAAIYALRDDPYEPVETVEEVVRGIIDGSTMCRASLAQTCARLRAAVAAEMAQGEG